MTRVVTPPDALDRYLRAHYAASRGGLDLFRRSARSQSSRQVRDALAGLAAEVAEDRAALLAVLVELGVERPGWSERAVAVGERLGRLKPNGSLVRRSSLSDFLEVEALSAAVHAKRLGWLTLRRLAETDERLRAQHLDHLLERADQQQALLEELRLNLAPQVFGPSRRDGRDGV